MAWAAVFVVPLAALYLWPNRPQLAASGTLTQPDWWTPLGWSVLLSAAVAFVATALAYWPGKLIGTIDIHSPHGRQRRAATLMLTALPMLLPVYVLCYAWAHLLDETSPLGQYLSAHRSLAMTAGLLTAGLSLVTWYWPLAALILSQGWRGLDGTVLESARLDAGRFTRFRKVTWPLMRMPILLAFGACLVLSMSETALFEIPLSTVRLPSIGRELSLAYEANHGDTTAIACGAWPLVLPAVALALALWMNSARLFGRRQDGATAQHPSGWRSWFGWAFFAALLLLSCAVPVGLLATFLHRPERFLELGLHADKLAWSAIVAVGAGILAVAVSWAALRVAPKRGDLDGWVRFAPSAPMECGGSDAAFATLTTAKVVSRPPHSIRLLAGSRRVLSAIMQLSILTTMFLPPTLVAVAFVRIMAAFGLDVLRDSWCILSIGLAARYAGLALIILWQADHDEDRQLSELAAVDGASAFRAWWHVHLPRRWPLGAGALALVTIFSLTERPLTVVLLPAGLPNLAEWLMGVMHAVRGEAVIAACLLMIGSYISLAVIVLLLHWLLTREGCAGMIAVLLLAACVGLAGCGKGGASTTAPKVLACIGTTGSGDGEFVYPRAIDIAPDGSILIVDKTARIQRLAADGRFIKSWRMPESENGKPVGMSIGPDGLLYVADTHYQRVVVFDLDGHEVRRWGRMGQGDGEFIYPTDIAFIGRGADMQVLVSEYGGNDRISVFRPDGTFVRTVGSCGMERGQFSRPAAMVVDDAHDRLYVADACNHRIAVYNLKLEVIEYWGSGGTGPGQLRYPYGLALTPDRSLLVCEFGNNRLQVFDSSGKSMRIYGQGGRELGQLAFPWGVAVDKAGRAFVVDAGNNRVQVWQL